VQIGYRTLEQLDTVLALLTGSHCAVPATQGPPTHCAIPAKAGTSVWVEGLKTEVPLSRERPGGPYEPASLLVLRRHLRERQERPAGNGLGAAVGFARLAGGTQQAVGRERQ